MGDRASLDRRISDEDQRACGRVDLLALERERRVSADDDVQLLLASVSMGLVVLLDDHARLDGDVGVHAEGADVEIVPDRVPVVAVSRAEALDVGEGGDREGTAHASTSSKLGWSRIGVRSTSVRASSRSFGSAASAARRCSSASSV